MTAREVLDGIKASLAEITSWPWVAEYSKEQGNCVLPPDAQSTREAVAVTRLYHQSADAVFIASAPSTVARLTAAVEAVLDRADAWEAAYRQDGTGPGRIVADDFRAAIENALNE